MPMDTILVVDDEVDTREALELILRREGHSVLTASSGQAALTSLQQDSDIDLVISDVKMPQLDGLALLRRVKAHDAGIVVVMMSGHNDVATAVDAMKEGAFDYLVKPFGKEEVLRTVQKALTLRTVLVENLALKQQVRDQFARAQVVGSSPTWRRVCAMTEQVAPSQATVLLTGESGTGKEVIARLLHRLSTRADEPFITLNAAALPSTLLEAELFGHEKGAFTGALHSKPGRFEQANGGTLFLDEIGEMSLEAQTKLLRVLQEGTFERVGGTRTLKVDVRIVTATNKHLPEEIAAQRFREDLYYRINVIEIHLPPLRERREDIPLLFTHFLQIYAKKNQQTITAVQQEALQRLQAYDWPGNVRELENVVERAVVLAQGPTIGVAELPPHFQDIEPAPMRPDDGAYLPSTTLAELERLAIAQALLQHNGNRQATARALDIGLATLYRKMKTYQLQ